MRIAELTEGQRLLIDRRRRYESQPEAAERLGVSVYRYRRWENGEEKCTGPALRSLQPFEVAFIRRLRRGLSVEALAAEVGCSPWWLGQMERGAKPCDRLLSYWQLADAG